MDYATSDSVKFDNEKTSVALLQDVLNKQGVRTLQYELLQIEGVICAPSFQYRVTDGRFVAYGQGKSKKEAKQNAAKNLLRIIQKEFPEVYSGPLVESHTDSTSDSTEAFENMNFGDNDERNPIGLLQELCTCLRLPPPVYKTVSEDGLPHQRLFTVSCIVSEYNRLGVGKSKKVAKRLAANNLFLMLKSKQADIIQKPKINENIDDFIRQESSSISGIKNSKSNNPQRLHDIHKTFPLTEGPICNYIKEMTDEQILLCDSKTILDDFTTEQKLSPSFIDFEEISQAGKYQTSILIPTPFTLGFYGESSISYEKAQEDASRRSIEFFKCILSNRGLRLNSTS